MIKRLRKFSIPLLISLSLSAQTGQTRYAYIATSGNVSLSTQSYALTLQQPATGALQVVFPYSAAVGANVYCSAACTFSVIVGATAPTATLGTVNKVNADDPTPHILVYTASNYSGGTTLATYNVAAGQTFPLDMGLTYLGGSATANVTFAIASTTATVNITVSPVEYH